MGPNRTGDLSEIPPIRPLIRISVGFRMDPSPLHSFMRYGGEIAHAIPPRFGSRCGNPEFRRWAFIIYRRRIFDPTLGFRRLNIWGNAARCIRTRSP